MKLYNNAKRLAAILVFAFVISIAAACACGGSGGVTEAPKINGSEAKWQELSVCVPEGMELVGGSALDSSDPNTAWIQRKGDELSYFLINITTAETAESTVKTTKELNSTEDISFDAGGVKWSGVKYKYAGVSDCFQVYGTVNGKTVLVSGSRFAADSAEALAVLGSIKLGG